MNGSGFELAQGVTTVVFGPNGAGKTTLLRDLVSELVDVSYLPQRPYLFRGLAGTNLGLGLTDEECGLAGQYARRFGLGDFLAQPARIGGGRTHGLSEFVVRVRPPGRFLACRRRRQ